MEACGVIAEYNPLHLGHVYHLKSTKEHVGLPIIVAMSGSFVQRGESALLDKFSRAGHAVANGADLVLELPTAFTLRSAQYFATGGVELLKATGLVSTLSCGTEHPNFPFREASKAMLAPTFQEKLHLLISEGLSYAVASSQLLNKLNPEYQLKEPNDILALEYTKALLNCKINPIYLKRIGQDYNNLTLETDSYASASAIRHQLKNSQSSTEMLSEAFEKLKEQVPQQVYQTLLKQIRNTYGNPFNVEATKWQLLRYQLSLSNPERIKQITLATEGMENLLYKTVNLQSYAEAVAQCTGKRYPASRIRRLFCQLLLQFPREYYLQDKPAYLRVLAFNDTGRQLLKEMKTAATLPIITKLGRKPFKDQSDSFRQQLELDCRATDCWALLHPQQLTLQSDYLISPLYVQKK